jgi:hypothetical protein
MFRIILGRFLLGVYFNSPIFVVMKMIVFKFLDTKYPNAFVKKTIFGNLTMYGNDFISTHGLTVELCNWFDVTQEFARNTIKTWESTLPVVVSIRNSTNPAVLVGETLVVNPTL